VAAGGGTGWSTRRVFTSDLAHGNAIVPFLNGSGQPNGAQLYPLGLGGSEAEASEIARWALGYNRSWPLGSLINSTPLAHGKGIDLNLPGHVAYSEAHPNRPKMVYAGADDGMLHAFFLETGPAGEEAGSEAWAYVPPDLLPSIASLYASNGQPNDPLRHVYGVASSPKVNDVCTGGCADAADWKTILVSGEGPGGTAYFALDITATPAAPSAYQGPPPFTVLWHTQDSSLRSAYGGTLGQSWSVPAFAFVGTTSTAAILLFGSGYDGNPADANDQGAYLSVANAAAGTAYLSLPHLGAPASPVATYAVIADSTVAVENSTNKAVAAYQADLGGRLWRLDGGSTAPGGTPLYNAGVTHPFYYSPAVLVTSGRNVVIALNDSTFDDPDLNRCTSTCTTAACGCYTPNLTVLFDNDGVLDAEHKVEKPLTDVYQANYNRRACTSTCPKFTSAARPVGSPLLLTNNADGATASLQALFLIYQPSSDSCTMGTSTLVVLDITGTTVVQSVAKQMAGKASGLFVGAGGEVMVAASGAGSNPSKLSVVAGEPSATTFAGTAATARVVGVAEKDD
jgi:hypothetical protein